MGEGLAETVTDMLRRGNVPAEHHGIGPLAQKGREGLDEGRQLGIRLIQQSLGLAHQGEESRIGSKAGAGLQVNGVFILSVFVVDPGLQALVLVQGPVAQRTEGGARGRANAAHQRQGAPKRQPPLPLASPDLLHHSKAVVQHRLLERHVGWRQGIGILGGLVFGKGAVLVPVP